MADLDELYREVIFEHSKKPRNFGKLEGANRIAGGHNPLCGDKVTVYLDVKGQGVKDVHFDGKGCAICTASASLMTQALKGKSEPDAKALIERFCKMLTGDPSAPAEDETLGKLNALAGVRKFPVRVKCATLAWRTAEAALAGADESVRTE